MKQFEAEIIQIKTNNILFSRKITSMHFKNGFLWVFVVDFMDDGNSNDFVGFFLDRNGEYLDANNNLKAIIKNYEKTNN